MKSGQRIRNAALAAVLTASIFGCDAPARKHEPAKPVQSAAAVETPSPAPKVQEPAARPPAARAQPPQRPKYPVIPLEELLKAQTRSDIVTLKVASKVRYEAKGKYKSLDITDGSTLKINGLVIQGLGMKSIDTGKSGYYDVNLIEVKHNGESVIFPAEPMTFCAIFVRDVPKAKILFPVSVGPDNDTTVWVKPYAPNANPRNDIKDEGLGIPFLTF